MDFPAYIRGIIIPGTLNPTPSSRRGDGAIDAKHHDTLDPQPYALKPKPCSLYGGFPKLEVPFWGPYNKDHTSLGSILGYPNFGKLPYRYA